MELQVKLTLSDRLFDLLEDKLPNLGRRFEKALDKEVKAQTRKESSISISIVAPKDETPADDAPSPEDKPADAIPSSPEGKPEGEAAEAPAEEPKAEETPAPKVEEKTPGERIREIIDITRKRIEGEDYEANAGGERRKKYHKPVGDAMKQIAVTLGYDKPSHLPGDKIEAFRQMCAELDLDKDGNLVTRTPF